ncbi:carboxyl-terminal hydrolase [Anaeramoeba ignava]|uniref:ubiquitinyl hydrolase 1 n=1 Tax=Anaeramoeba ignava TaxID=1746090 RepID=A0A9Q0R5P7_ANAIG|nr:carboxyl-terminal hydrolase [Anaeramoeba ignava]
MSEISSLKSSKTQEKGKSVRIYATGLVNIRGSCYLNALLQSLSSCTSFYQSLLLLNPSEGTIGHLLLPFLNEIQSISFEKKVVSPLVLVNYIHENYFDLQTQDSHELLIKILDSIETQNSTKKNHSQKNSLTKINSILNKKNIFSEKKANLFSKHSYQLQNLEETQKFKDSINPFTGIRQTQLICKKCSRNSGIKYFINHEISLSFPQEAPQKNQSFTLENLLQNFFSNEFVDEVDCPNCSLIKTNMLTKYSLNHESKNLSQKSTQFLQKKINNFENLLLEGETNSWDSDTFYDNLIKTKSTMIKLTKFTILPKILCIHLQRKIYDPKIQKIRKLENFVSFPFLLNINEFKGNFENSENSENSSPFLDLSKSYIRRKQQKKGLEYIAEISDIDSKEKDGLYELKSVIVHHGPESSGHFTAYKKMTIESLNKQYLIDQWIHISDRFSQPVSMAEVLGCNAYMLFYEKI